MCQKIEKVRWQQGGREGKSWYDEELAGWRDSSVFVFVFVFVVALVFVIECDMLSEEAVMMKNRSK